MADLEGATHRITLSLAEATDDQLRDALSEARAYALICERQGSFLHTWTVRGDAIAAEIERRGR